MNKLILTLLLIPYPVFATTFDAIIWPAKKLIIIHDNNQIYTNSYKSNRTYPKRIYVPLPDRFYSCERRKKKNKYICVKALP